MYRLQPCWLCLLCVLSITAAANRRSRDPAPAPSPLPTAWAWIQAQPELATAAQVLTVLGADQQLMMPFTGTLLLPTNEAFENYLSRTQAPLELTGTTSTFWKAFLGKLINYHVLLRSTNAAQYTESATFSTKYVSINGGVHRVTFVAASGCNPAQHSTSKHDSSSPGTACRTQFILDEQQNEVTFAAPKATVLGGGQISTLNAVLQPNDIFPSLAAAVAGPDFAVLRNVLDVIDAGLNVTLLSDLEKVPGTLAAPLNQAFEGLDLGNFTAATLLNVVSYHFCGPVQVDYRLLYTPFTYPSRKNPCTTLLARTVQNRSLKLSYKYQYNGLNEAPTMWINFPTGSVKVPVNGTAPIVMADITIPLHVGHAISKLLVPPQ